MAKVLPPDVSAATFERFRARLAEIVGPDWVFTGDDDAYLYSDAYSPFKGDEANALTPSGGVAPASVEQVQQIVVAANQYKVPLWPVSTGRNLGYGGSAPRLRGTLVLDLKRMNRVLEVSDSLCYALVEPGVSYFDFAKYLDEHKHRVWMDCPDPGWGSLIGNAMDHGVGHTPYRDHFGSHCGMEVVLPNGELLRTGSGALPNSRQFNIFPYGYGPHVAPIFGQANFGIVTKMGFSLLPAPEASRNDIISVPRVGDVVPFLEAMCRLVSEFALDSSWNLESPLFASRDPAVRAVVSRADGQLTAELDRTAEEKGLPAWRTRVRFYGAPAVMDAKWEYVQRRIREAVPTASFQAGAYFRFPEDRDRVEEDPAGDMFAKAAVAIPSMSIFSFSAVARTEGHVFFAPIIPMAGEEVLRAQQVFRRAYKDLGLTPEDVPVGGWAWFRRNLVTLFVQMVTADAEANKKMRANIRHLIAVAADNGWAEYRTPPVFMDDLAAVYSFNNHAALRFNEKLKDALDPNGILAPGRSGIWPRRLRSFKGKSA
jgi:(+)-pinoresinol hydroxylase